MRWLEIGAALCATAALALAQVAAANADGTTLPEAMGSPFDSGRWMAGFHAGYAFPFAIDPSKTDVTESEFVALVPRLSVGITDPFGGDRWYRGNLEMGFEGHFLIQTQPHSGYFAGGSLLARLNALAFERRRFVPFFEIGLGIGHLEFDLERRADGFNFVLQSAVGTHWFFSPRAAVTAQFRYHHISNAEIQEPNVAIDSGLVLLGITVPLEGRRTRRDDEGLSRALRVLPDRDPPGVVTSNRIGPSIG